MTEPALLVALTSVFIAAITAAGGIAVAIIANKKESKNSAEGAMNATMEQRIILRDEQIQALERKVSNRDEIISHLREEIAHSKQPKGA